METTKQKGDSGEEIAAQFLQGLGYKIIARNWIAGRFELDLIAENKTHIVFVEVKLRNSNAHGEPWEAVNKTKRKRICMSADAYIRQKQCDKEPRFDIISILKNGEDPNILHLEDAFYPTVL